MITCENNDGNYYECGYVIGSYKNYYPIVPFKTELMCGHYNLKQFLLRKQSITFRHMSWTTIKEFLKYVKTSNIPIIKTYLLSKKICFIYVNE